MSRNNKKVVLVTGGTGLVGKGIEDFIASGALASRARLTPRVECVGCTVSPCDRLRILPLHFIHTWQTPRRRRRRSTSSSAPRTATYGAY